MAKQIYMLYTVFPLISTGPQISTAPFGIHTEISTSLLISVTPLNTTLIRIITKFFRKLNQNAYGPSMKTIKQ